MSQAHALLNHIIRPVSLALGEPHLIHEEILLSAATLRGFDPFAEDKDEGLGVFGISPTLHRQVWDEYLAFEPEKASQVRGFASQRQFLVDPDAELITNTQYAAAVGISALQWVRPSWPMADDAPGLTQLWADLTHTRERHCIARFQRTLEKLCLRDTSDSVFHPA